ncbi:vWA domain-containing protein [Paenibacillus radicis (ex Gao et al. 2016)]|uniref:Lipoprotein n=1 Tax=Paenibacillus radicis (ex Gao et al. 2016) TaxID=1737354 RepID=A0A917M698_9BACL|nr:VWA domain-containing protein [Paenibacillus radicis (ex Gao et al. 2016)]GGG80028.1 lipoprotein [Paenibacillus radicis (ex Gao et al. 2016)]
MQFLSPISAIFALSLPAIVLMYVLKRVYIDTEIASHLLWNRVLREQEANRPWQKLRSRPLLLLQLLAAALLVFALMQPYWTREAAATGHTVLVMDSSASMTVRSDDGRSLLQQNVQLAEDWIAGQKEGRRITIIATGEQPEIIASGELSHRDALTALRALEPNFGASDNLAALSLADSLLGDEADGSIMLYSDGRWSDASAVNELQLHAKLVSAGANGAEAAPSSNRAIVHFGVKTDPGAAGYNKAVITIRNDADTMQQLKVNVYAEGSAKPFATETVRAEAGGWTSLTVDKLPAEAAYYKAQFAGGSDGYAADDVAYQFPSESRAKRALLVSKGNLFLEKALQLAGVSTVKADPEQYIPDAEDQKELDWIVVDGSGDKLLADKSWEKLLKSKPVWYIDHPKESGAETVIPDNNRAELADHPVVAYLSFADTHIGRLLKPKDAPLWGKAILTYGGIPAIYAGTVEGRPQLRFTFDFQDTDLPLRPEFPVLVVQAADWMSGGSRSELGTAVAGSALSLSFSGEAASAGWKTVEQLSDYGEGSAEQSVTMKGTSGETVKAPSIPGLYRLVEYDKANKVIADRLLTVTADAAESAAFGKVEPIAPSYVSGTNGEGSGSGQPNSGQLAPQTAATASVAAWIALLLLIILAGEWEVYRRGHAS